MLGERGYFRFPVVTESQSSRALKASPETAARHRGWTQAANTCNGIPQSEGFENGVMPLGSLKFPISTCKRLVYCNSLALQYRIVENTEYNTEM